MAPRHRVYKMVPNEVECFCWMKMAIELKITLQRRDVATNDNDNDTLREVPQPSNEGLALQARVSGPWPHKKESVLLV